MDIRKLIDNAQQMPNIPEVVQELILSFNDKDVNSTEISAKVAKDQVLTAKVLRMANSAKYGGNRQVGSVNDAVVVLGFNALRTMVLASGLTSAFKAPEGFDINQFWLNSFTVAGLCKWVAKHTDLDPEVAYTCGMMHNIGELLIHMLVPEQAAKVDSLASLGAHNQRARIEETELGFDFTAAGGELAERWKFPAEIVNGVRNQLQPLVDDEVVPLAAVLFLANYIHTINCSDTPEPLLNHFPKEVADLLNINAVELMAHLDETKSLNEGLEDMLG